MAKLEDIKFAYLSALNMDRIIEQLILVLKEFNIDIYKLYSEEVLRNFISDLAQAIFVKSLPNLTEERLEEPRKTILLLNRAVVKSTVVNVIQLLNKSNERLKTKSASPRQYFQPPQPTPNEHLITSNPLIDYHEDINMVRHAQLKKQRELQNIIPLSPTVVESRNVVGDVTSTTRNLYNTIDPIAEQRKRIQYQFPHLAAGPGEPLSTPVNEKVSQNTSKILRKKLSGSMSVPISALCNEKSTPLKMLKKDAKIHEFFVKRKMQTCPDTDIYLISDTKETKDQRMVPIPDQVPITRFAPWRTNKLNITNEFCVEDGEFEIPFITSMQDVQRIDLASVHFDVRADFITTSQNIFYFAEDDDPMIPIHLSIKSQSLEDVLEDLRQEISQKGRYRYSITLNRFTQKVKIVQQSDNINSILHLLFEQTKHNCGDLLGFGKFDYHGEKEYESISSILVKTSEEKRIVQMYLPQLLENPVLLLDLSHSFKTKQQMFTDYTLCEYKASENLSNGKLLLKFCDENFSPVSVTFGEKSHIIFRIYGEQEHCKNHHKDYVGDVGDIDIDIEGSEEPNVVNLDIKSDDIQYKTQNENNSEWQPEISRPELPDCSTRSKTVVNSYPSKPQQPFWPAQEQDYTFAKMSTADIKKEMNPSPIHHSPQRMKKKLPTLEF